MILGTIVEIDQLDGLGWIETDTGEKIRFGGSALKGFRTVEIGMRVVVADTKPGYKGVPKATRVVPESSSPKAQEANLPTWVGLWFSEPMSSASFIEAARRLGVPVNETQEGLYILGFFGALVPEYPHRVMEIPKGVSVPRCCLMLSGGSNEVEFMTNAMHGAMGAAKSNHLLEKVLPVASQTSTPRAPKNILNLTKVVAALAPLCTAVVLSKANHTVVTPDEFLAKSKGVLNGDETGYRLWTRTLFHQDFKGAHLATVGMWLFGLPDFGIPVHGDDLNERVADLAEVIQTTMGHRPPAGSLPTSRGAMEIVPLRGASWIVPPGVDYSARAYATFGQYRNMAELMVGTTHERRAGTDRTPAIEYFYRAGGKSVAFSNGTSGFPQAGGSEEEQNRRIELTIHSTTLGPWADFWLSWASSAIVRSPAEHPILAYDRVTLDAPRDGIAGVIMWPLGHIQPLGPETVYVWDLLPITPGEVRGFRADPSNQQRWLDARNANHDIDQVLGRWPSVLADELRA